MMLTEPIGDQGVTEHKAERTEGFMEEGRKLLLTWKSIVHS